MHRLASAGLPKGRNKTGPRLSGRVPLRLTFHLADLGLVLFLVDLSGDPVLDLARSMSPGSSPDRRVRLITWRTQSST